MEEQPFFKAENDSLIFIKQKKRLKNQSLFYLFFNIVTIRLQALITLKCFRCLQDHQAVR